MNNKGCLRWVNGLVCALLMVSAQSLFADGALGQEASSVRIERVKRILQDLNKIPPRNRARLSPGLQIFMRMAAELGAANKSRPAGNRATGDVSANTLAAKLDSAEANPPAGTVWVSDPRLDFVTSGIQGFTQFQSSTAWCGDNIVVAYTDTGAALQAAALNANLSLDGISISKDKGQTFTDLKAILPDPSSPNNDQLLTGNSVAACSGDQFYYASTGFSDTDCGGGSAILFSRAASGNLSQWSPPSPAINKCDTEFTLDAPWLAADPTDPNRLYLTYTSFDISFGGGPPFCEFAQTLEMVTSSDAGFTWSLPVLLDTECQGGEFGESSGFSIPGANVVVSPGGKVYVAYLAFGSPSEIRFLKSEDHGRTFGATQKVASITPAGGTIFFPELQGDVRADTLPSLAVDRSRGPGRETVYLAWVQGDRAVTAGTSTYAYGDVVLAKSTNFGASFVSLGPISGTPKNFPGKGHDQFTPGIAVDTTGAIQACYYDRRNDLNNIAIDRYCSTSRDQGRSWADHRASSPHWLPFYADFRRSGLGLFDTVGADFLQQNAGFFASFEFMTDGNPDIVGRRF